MNKIEHVAVVGAGMMGAEIALVCAVSGMKVVLKDVRMDLAVKGKQRIKGILDKWGAKKKLSHERIDATLQNISVTDTYAGFERVRLVVEAALEDVELKTSLFRELDGICPSECILATNTSSIPVTQLAAATKRPDRFVGMHFFSPASVMKLVEVIPGVDTSEETIDQVLSVVDILGKVAVRAVDRAGFMVNRLLFAFFNEAWRMVDEGAATPEDIDTAVKLGLGHPVGIFQMQDLVGLDNALSVSGVLSEEYGDRYRPAPLLKRKVAAGHVGRRAKRGWFIYD